MIRTMKGRFLQLMRKQWIIYAGVFVITVFLALILLIGCAILPQNQINEHVLDSISTITRDIREDYIISDHSKGSMLDVATDSLMIHASVGTNSRYLGSVLTNPIYGYSDLPDWRDRDEVLTRLAYDMPHDTVWFYARYWMGFRVLLRLALTFLTYNQIKRYLAFVFFTAFAMAICSVAKNTNARAAFLFAFSVILVRPHVIAACMQFSCCFLISFFAMLLIPWLCWHPRYEGVFFMEVGMITMYFDFYTVPLITFGLPMIYLCLMFLEREKPIRIKWVLKRFAAWMAGYGLMWIAKLTLTSALTPVNALVQGFGAFAERVGIQKEESLTNYYSVETASKAVGEVIFSDETGKVIYLFVLTLIVLVAVGYMIRNKAWIGRFGKGLPLLLLAAMPFGWFAATLQPLAIHAFFQYRSIVLAYWGMSAYAEFLIYGRGSVSLLKLSEK